MEIRRRNDFVVNSKGHCFVCLNKVSNKLNLSATVSEQDASSSSASLHTLQCLAQYLQLDMTRVFSQKGSIPESLLAEVKQSRLKAELCEQCASLANRFSKRFQQWKQLEMEMHVDLDNIQNKLQTAGKPERFKTEEDQGVEEVLTALRMETIEKCTSKLRNQAPRINIQKLTNKTVNNYSRTRDDKMKTSEQIRERKNGPQFDDDVKLERQTDEANDNGFLDASKERSDDEDSMEHTPINNVASHDVLDDNATNKNFLRQSTNVMAAPSTIKENSVKLNCSINPETGKYKCNLCSKEFGKRGFRYHYQSVHLQIRYKCNLCGKMFTCQPNYKAHLRKDHLGVTYKCLVCNQEFKYKSTFNRHRQKNTCQTEAELGNVYKIDVCIDKHT